MRLLIASAALLALVSLEASAADVPNVIGTWSIANKRAPAAAAAEGNPALSGELASLSIKIIRQEGDSFSGTIVGPKRQTEHITGSFRRDGRTFVYSSEKTAGVGKIRGNEMEICRTDAGCALLTRSK
jgi:hypothetical protein